MKVQVYANSKILGEEAATCVARTLNKAIEEKGKARLLLSTGASQFDTLSALVKQEVDWSKVEMFHLDEYVDLPESHIASFRRYLKERFVKFLNLKAVYYVNGEGNIHKNIQDLTDVLRQEPIDVGLVGIGENAHIAFNDPPANFDTKDAYIVVNLDEDCKKQQVGEGWFPTINDVPKQAISMTVYQILLCKVIICCVPYRVKANAVKKTLENDVTNMIPATILKTHSNTTLFVDQESASLVDKDVLARYK